MKKILALIFALVTAFSCFALSASCAQTGETVPERANADFCNAEDWNALWKSGAAVIICVHDAPKASVIKVFEGSDEKASSVSTGEKETLTNFRTDKIMQDHMCIVKVPDGDGKVVENDSGKFEKTFTIKVKNSFFNKIAAFFRMIFNGFRYDSVIIDFGKNVVYSQKIKVSMPGSEDVMMNIETNGIAYRITLNWPISEFNSDELSDLDLIGLKGKNIEVEMLYTNGECYMILPFLKSYMSLKQELYEDIGFTDFLYREKDFQTLISEEELVDGNVCIVRTFTYEYNEEPGELYLVKFYYNSDNELIKEVYIEDGEEAVTFNYGKNHMMSEICISEFLLVTPM